MEAMVDGTPHDGSNKGDQDTEAKAHTQADTEGEAAKLEVAVEEGGGRRTTAKVDEAGHLLRLGGGLSHGVVASEAADVMGKTDF